MQLFHAFGRIACALVCALLLATPAMAADYKQEYKLSVVPGPTSGWALTAMYFADQVREHTGGRVNIKVYPAGQLFAGKQTNEFPLLRQGAIDFALGSTINWSPQVKELNLPCMPFFIGAQPHPYKAMDAMLAGKSGQMMREAIEKKGRPAFYARASASHRKEGRPRHRLGRERLPRTDHRQGSRHQA